MSILNVIPSALAKLTRMHYAGVRRSTRNPSTLAGQSEALFRPAKLVRRKFADLGPKSSYGRTDFASLLERRPPRDLALRSRRRLMPLVPRFCTFGRGRQALLQLSRRDRSRHYSQDADILRFDDRQRRASGRLRRKQLEETE